MPTAARPAATVSAAWKPTRNDVHDRGIAPPSSPRAVVMLRKAACRALPCPPSSIHRARGVLRRRPDRDCDVLVQACNRHRRRDPHNIKRGAGHPHKARRIRDGSHARNGPMDDSDPASRRATLTLAEFAPHLAFSRFRCNPYCAWTVCQGNG